MHKSPSAYVIDDALPPEAFAYWAVQIPSKHSQRMLTEGPGENESELYRLCLATADSLYPSLTLEQQVYWPVMYQLPLGHPKVNHVDTGMISCIFHTCPEWHPSWGGELLINTGDDGWGMELVVPYRPNRLVIFDASPVHRVQPSTYVRHAAQIPFHIAGA